MTPTIGAICPNIGVSEWIQGGPVNIDSLRGDVIVVEVFQVNCPGCFMYALPAAVDVHHRYADRGVTVLGLATAFEDFDKNTVANLRLLVDTGEVVGETRRALATQPHLYKNNRLTYTIPFPLAMDNLTPTHGVVTDEAVLDLARSVVPGFDRLPPATSEQVTRQVRDHLAAKKFAADTFERFKLRGTPSAIIVDRDGILRDVSFGSQDDIESRIKRYL